MPTDDGPVSGEHDTSTSSAADSGVEAESTDAPLEASPGVLSGFMNDQDFDSAGGLDEPGVNDDLKPRPARSDPGFDGWLDGDEDDAAAEIADWVAFAGNTDGESPTSAETGGPADETENAEYDPHEDTAEFSFGGVAGDEGSDRDAPPGAEEPNEVYADSLLGDDPAFDAADDPADDADSEDPDELLIFSAVPTGTAPNRTDDEPADEDTGSEKQDDDTGEILGEGTTPPVLSNDEPNGDAPVFDFSDFTGEHYVQASTREHQDLAAEIEFADSEDTEQVALSAPIPGLNSGVVGFEDVVASEQGDTTPAPPRERSDLLVRVGTGATLIAAFLASLLWRPAITVLALAVFVVAAGEFYGALLHHRYRPMSIFGFIGIIAAGLGVVVWGVVAIPVTLGLMATVILLYGSVSRRRSGAVGGFVLTVLVAGWIGGFGSFAFAIIAVDDFQVLVATVVIMVALVDMVAYFVGSSIGRRQLAPVISPMKTIEGLVAGTFTALITGAGASLFVEVIDLPTGLILGVAVAVFAPLGDLAVSVVKRSLNIKDMGSILPGHGGLLDRIDAIIAVIPAAWVVFVWAGLL